MRNSILLSTLVLGMILSNGAHAYEGFGSSVTGGGSYPVVEVTNTNDSGPGSLREALKYGNRTVRFKPLLGGTIRALSPIVIQGSNVTLDGYPVRSLGMTLEGNGLMINGTLRSRNIIIKNLRILNAAGDGITIKNGAQNIVIDHCTILGSGDGNIDIGGRGTERITVSYNILGKNQKNSLIAYESRFVSYHHNVLVGSSDRNPQVSYGITGAYDGNYTTLDLRYNLIWGWSVEGTTARYGSNVNIVGNHFSGTKPSATIIVANGSGGNFARAFVAANYSANGFAFRSTPVDQFQFGAPLVNAAGYSGKAACNLRSVAGPSIRRHSLETDLMNSIRCTP